MRLACSTALICVLALGARPGFAQEAEAPQKNETTATILGLILPGAGHIYAGETGRGMLFMGTTGLAFAYGFTDGQCKRPYTDVRTCELDKNETLAGISLAAALGIYAFSAWDAHRAVKRTNARRRNVVGSVNVSTLLAVSPIPQPTAYLRVDVSQRP